MTDVTLLNIARTIDVPDGQTILSAALDDGIAFPHGCKSGRCGSCKSRLAAGAVELLDHTRFALSSEERENGLILACRAVPKGPVSIAWLVGEDEAAGYSLREDDAEVVEIANLTHDIRGVRLRIAGPALQFASGQYATLAIPGRPARDYSMANPPGADVLEFHVRRVPDGVTSSAIHERLSPGSRLRLSGPRGSAHLRIGHTGPILAVAGGSGLAPILSILESIVAQGMRQPIRVYVGARDEHDLYRLDRMGELAAQHGDMTLTPVLSAPSAPTARRTGFLHAAIRADLRDLDGWKCYTAGPLAMIDAVSEAVVSLGLAREDLHADVFFTPLSAESADRFEAAG